MRYPPVIYCTRNGLWDFRLGLLSSGCISNNLLKWGSGIVQKLRLYSTSKAGKQSQEVVCLMGPENRILLRLPRSFVLLAIGYQSTHSDGAMLTDNIGSVQQAAWC